jgi:carboxyl-terminal processing protease
MRAALDWARRLVAFLAILALGAGVGVYVDQAYPEYVPALGIRSNGELDSPRQQEALRVLKAHYYDRNLDYKKLSRGSVKGMVDALDDPYSTYFDPDQYKRFTQHLAGDPFIGIGVYIEFVSDYPHITGVIPGAPADKAGVRPDDIVLKIDGKDTRGMKADEGSALIRGPEGTTVTLTIRRGDSVMEIGIKRARIQTPMVRSTTLEGQVLYLRIYSFGDTAVAEFDAALKAGLPGARSVILDLRDDGGGRVDAAEAVISRFVASGEAYEVRDRDGHVERHDVSGDHSAAGLPVEVLVNSNTASASEMVAGSLQAHKRAQLVGVKTFGKGSVQLDYPLSDGSDLHITIRRWFLPDGRSVDKKGLVPDIEVQLPNRDDMFDVARPGRGHDADRQLNRALQTLGAAAQS